MATQGLLERIRQLELQNEQLVNALADIVMCTVDSLCRQGLFAEVDELTRQIDVGNLDVNLIVVFLGVTKPLKHKLHDREEFVEAATRRLQEIAPGRVERLMDGLT